MGKACRWGEEKEQRPRGDRDTHRRGVWLRVTDEGTKGLVSPLPCESAYLSFHGRKESERLTAPTTQHIMGVESCLCGYAGDSSRLGSRGSRVIPRRDSSTHPSSWGSGCYWGKRHPLPANLELSNHHVKLQQGEFYATQKAFTELPLWA